MKTSELAVITVKNGFTPNVLGSITNSTKSCRKLAAVLGFVMLTRTKFPLFSGGMHKMADDVKEIKSSLTDITREMKKQRETSYADALRMSRIEPRRNPPTTSNGINISSNKSNSSSTQIEKSIKEKLNLNQAKTGVTKLKHISNFWEHNLHPTVKFLKR